MFKYHDTSVPDEPFDTIFEGRLKLQALINLLGRPIVKAQAGYFESIVNEPNVIDLATQRAKDLISSLAGPIYARLSFYVRNGTVKASAWSAMPLP